MNNYNKILIYLVGFKILDEYWDLNIDHNDDLGSFLSETDPFKWDNCLSGDPAYEEEYFQYLQRNYKGKQAFSYDEAIEIIKGFFLSYKPIAKIKDYVLQQLNDKEKMAKRFEDMAKEEIYKIHNSQK